MTARIHERCAGNPDVLAWLREHDLDPSNVAVGEQFGPFIDGDRMTVHIYRANGDGHRYVDSATNDAAVESCTVALRRPLPELPFPATVPA